MPPPIISDTFEALENLGGQMQQQTKQAAKTIIQEGKKNLGLAAKDQQGQQIEGGSGATGQTSSKPQSPPIQKMEQIAKQKASQRYKQIQEQILAIANRKQQELPKQVTGKPGFSEDKMIKQIEEEKKPEAEKKREQMEKEPIPMQREKRKSEMFRGAAG